jgi:integrase
LPSRAALAGLAGIGLETGEDGVADLALEGPQRLFTGFPHGHFLVVVGAALAVLVPELGYRGHGEPGEIWTARQLRVFLTTAKGHRLFAFYHLAAYTGARRGELLNLRWRDIDLASAEINISGSTAVIGGTRIEGTTKSGRSRKVSIDAGTVEVLKEHRSLQAEERLLAGQGWRASDDYVFTTGWGGPVHPDTVSSLVADLIEAYDATVRESGVGEMLPRARLHDLRHLHATTLLLAGVPVHVVAARLGHADPSVTLRVYAHVIRDQVAEAADIFARSIQADDMAAVSKSVSKKPAAGRATGL